MAVEQFGIADSFNATNTNLIVALTPCEIMRKSILLAAICSLMIVYGCDPATSPNAEKPVYLNDGIAVGTLDEVGMKKEVIKEVVDSINSGYYPNRHSLLIYKDDKLVFEKYFTGRDYCWGRDLGIVSHSDTVLHDMRSVSKSIVSACIGIAIEQGKIEGVDQKVFDFFKDYNQYNIGGKGELTIRHLLTMTSGLEWDETVPADNTEAQMEASEDIVGFILSRNLVSAPGTVWNYNGGTTELLANIILRTTGKNVYAFAKEYLFEPMGINHSQWTNYYGKNNPAAASGLRLSSRDMLKFGILYQNKGKWGSTQIVPMNWVMDSFAPGISLPAAENTPNGAYGYQFWIYNDSIQGKPVTVQAAVGNGDQRIYIDQNNKLIIVTTAGIYNMWDIQNNAKAIHRKLYDSFSVNQNDLL